MFKEILVIDDNPDIRSLLSSILKEQKFLIRTQRIMIRQF